MDGFLQSRHALCKNAKAAPWLDYDRLAPRSITLCLVDEYETEFDLPGDSIDRPFTSAELIRFLADCSPSPLESDCQLRISSSFHDDLQALLDEHLGREAE